MVDNSIVFNGKKIDEFIEEEIRNGFPGAVLAVVRNGKILKQSAYGYKSRYDENQILLTNPELLTTETMFDVASLTKMYATNYTLMQLVTQGKLNVNEPIQKYVNEYVGCNPEEEYRETRLVKDLLTHTAGYEPTIEFYDPARVPSDQYSQERSKTEEIIITKVGFQRPRGDIQLPVYSDIDYMLLGIIIHRITGISIDQYVQNNFYIPLGLTHTLFNPLRNTQYQKSDFAGTELKGNTRGGTIHFPNVRTQVVRGEVQDEKAFYSLDGISGHAGLFSNLHDMIILTQLMLNNGTYANHQFWSKDVQDQFVQPYAPDPSYGLGWRLNANKSLPWFGLHASDQAYGHTGWTGMCTVIDPKYSLAIILFTGRRHTPCINKIFDGEKYETGKYGAIMTMIYEALNLQQCL